MQYKKVWIVFGMVFLLLMLVGVCSAADEKQIDVNKATAEELAKVPGLDAAIASKMVEKRKENGEFVDLEELLDIEGIDANLLRNLKKYLVIDAAGTCNC